MIKEITHEVDLFNLFPDYEHFTFDTRNKSTRNKSVESEESEMERLLMVTVG